MGGRRYFEPPAGRRPSPTDLRLREAVLTAVGLAGFGLLRWFIRRSKKPIVSTAPELSEADVAKYKQAAERELSRFDE